MLDIKFIRENPDIVKRALTHRGVKMDLDGLLDLNEKRRIQIKTVDDLRAEQNKMSDEISKLSGSERDDKISKSRELKSRLQEAEQEAQDIEERFQAILRKIPNIPEDDVPVGKDERDNKVIREVGERRKFDFAPRDYMEIATELDLIDTKRAGKVSGSRFGYIKNEAVLLEFALVQFALEKLRERGFIPVIPPVLIKEEMMQAMGYVDSEKDRAERYYLPEDKLYFVGTSEQSIGPMHADEIISEEKLPLRYAGFSTCFRREAGSYGKDTQGILRVHQFDKVEMFIYAAPETSREEHRLMLSIEEELMQALNIPYRVVHLSTGDIAAPSASTFDIEAWLPGQDEGRGQYRETHSTSNTTDFQARRLKVRVRRKDGRVEFVHILNGTAFAIGRMIIAILENYQREDGSVEIPEVLRPYMNGLSIISKK